LAENAKMARHAMEWCKTSFHAEAASYSSDKNDLRAASSQWMVSHEGAKKAVLNLRERKVVHGSSWIKAERFL